MERESRHRVQARQRVHADEGCTERVGVAGAAKSCLAILEIMLRWRTGWPALGFIQGSDDPRAGSTSAIP